MLQDGLSLAPAFEQDHFTALRLRISRQLALACWRRRLTVVQCIGNMAWAYLQDSSWSATERWNLQLMPPKPWVYQVAITVLILVLHTASASLQSQVKAATDHDRSRVSSRSSSRPASRSLATLLLLFALVASYYWTPQMADYMIQWPVWTVWGLQHSLQGPLVLLAATQASALAMMPSIAS